MLTDDQVKEHPLYEHVNKWVSIRNPKLFRRLQGQMKLNDYLLKKTRQTIAIENYRNKLLNKDPQTHP